MRRRGARMGLTAVTALGTLALAAPAGAELTGPGSIRDGKNIGMFHNIDFVGAFGYPVGSTMTVDVYRGDHRIASATGQAVDTPEGGALEVNHGPEGAPLPGDCWESYTPDVRPGDRIRVTGDGGVDEAIVDNITADGPAHLNAGTGNVEFSGRATLIDGTPIPIARLDSGEVRNTSKFRGGPQDVIRTAGTADGWTAIYDPNVPMNNREPAGLTPATRTEMLLAGDHAMGYGHVAPLPLETQLIEGDADTPGPALGCEALAPAAQNAVGTSDRQALNIADLAAVAAGGDAALTLGGSAAAGVGALNITLSDGTNSVAVPAQLGSAPNVAGGPQGWTATFTKDHVSSLADGELVASGDFAAGGVTMAIVKDTVAPTISADLAPGRYTGAQQVALRWDGADSVTYRTDGAAATESDLVYVGTPITLGQGTHTIRALAVDAVGNRTEAAFAYTIDAVPALPAGPGAVPGAPVRPLAPPSVGRPAASLQVRGLKLPSTLRSAAARRRGIRAKMRLAAGTRVVRLSLYRRLSDGRLRLVGRVVRRPRRSGAYAVRMDARALRRALRPGRYVLVATPGTSRRTMRPDDEQERGFRIVR